MHAVLKVEGRDLRHSFEEERQERNVEFRLCEFRIRGIEFRHVLQPKIAGNFYSRVRSWRFFLQFGKDGPHARFHLRYRKSLGVRRSLRCKESRDPESGGSERSQPVLREVRAEVSPETPDGNPSRVPVFLQHPLKLRRVGRYSGGSWYPAVSESPHYENGTGLLGAFRRGFRVFSGVSFSAGSEKRYRGENGEKLAHITIVSGRFPKRISVCENRMVRGYPEIRERQCQGEETADAAYVQKPFGKAEVTAMPYNAFATSGQKMFARSVIDPLAQSARPEWCGAEMSADVETLMLPKPAEKNTEWRTQRRRTDLPKQRECDRHYREAEQKHSLLQKHVPNETDEKALVRDARESDNAERVSYGFLIYRKPVGENESERRLHSRKPNATTKATAYTGRSHPQGNGGSEFGFRLSRAMWCSVRGERKDEQETKHHRRRNEPDDMESESGKESSKRRPEGESRAERHADGSISPHVPGRINISDIRLRNGKPTARQTGKETSYEKCHHPFGEAEKQIPAYRQRGRKKKGAFAPNPIGKRTERDSSDQHPEGKERKCQTVRECGRISRKPGKYGENERAGRIFSGSPAAKSRTMGGSTGMRSPRPIMSRNAVSTMTLKARSAECGWEWLDKKSGVTVLVSAAFGNVGLSESLAITNRITIPEAGTGKRRSGKSCAPTDGRP